MPTTYAYLAICPNPFDDISYSGPSSPKFAYIKLGHTVDPKADRLDTYNTYNPSIYMRLLKFNNSLDTATRNKIIADINASLGSKVPPVSAGSSSGLFLQRCCLQAFFDKGELANEWFYARGRYEACKAIATQLGQGPNVMLSTDYNDESQFVSLFFDVFSKQ